MRVALGDGRHNSPQALQRPSSTDVVPKIAEENGHIFGGCYCHEAIRLGAGLYCLRVVPRRLRQITLTIIRARYVKDHPWEICGICGVCAAEKGRTHISS